MSPRLISVVVPVLNDERTLAVQLSALARQDYVGSWEVIVADNGSSDASRQVALEHLASLPGGRLVDASARRGSAHARNIASREARGDFLAFCDADDRAHPNWLSALAQAARVGAVVAGRLSVEALNRTSARAGHPGPPRDRPMVAHRFLPFASGGNCGLWTSDFRRLGGFDETLLRAQDIDLSWRAQLAGLEIVFSPRAVVERRDPRSARELARQHYAYGKGNAGLYRRHRSVGMPRPGLASVARDWADLLRGLVLLPWSYGGRAEWALRAGLRSGQLVGSLENRVLFL